MFIYLFVCLTNFGVGVTVVFKCGYKGVTMCFCRIFGVFLHELLPNERVLISNTGAGIFPIDFGAFYQQLKCMYKIVGFNSQIQSALYCQGSVQHY